VQEITDTALWFSEEASCTVNEAVHRTPNSQTPNPLNAAVMNELVG